MSGDYTIENPICFRKGLSSNWICVYLKGMTAESMLNNMSLNQAQLAFITSAIIEGI